MSVDHRDALLWPQKDNFIKEDYSLAAEATAYPRNFGDSRSSDVNYKAEAHMGCWANNTPNKDSSPSSTEPTSMLSDKSSSRGTFENKNSEHTCFSTDTGDTEHPISEGSLSPPLTSNVEIQNSSLQCPPQNSQPEASQNGQNVPITTDVVMSQRPITSIPPKDQLPPSYPTPRQVNNFSDSPRSPSIKTGLPNYGYNSTYPPFPPRANESPNHSGFPPPERSFNPHMHSQYRPYAPPEYPYSDPRKLTGHSYAEDFVQAPRRPACNNEQFYPPTPQKFPNAYQPHRSPNPPHPYMWNANQQHPYMAMHQNENAEMRRRFEMQQRAYPSAPSNRRFPGLTSQEYYQQMQDRSRFPPYPHPDPYAHLRAAHGLSNDPMNYYSDYPNAASRFPKPNYPHMGNSCMPNRAGPSYPWGPEASYLSQSRPFRPSLESPKKRSAPSTGRGSKRRRTSLGNDEKSYPPRSSASDVHASLALSKLLTLNVANCLSTPALQSPMDIHPPEPALKKKLPCHEVTPSSELPPNCAQKYMSLPFNLHRSKLLTEDDLASFVNRDSKVKTDFRRNYLKRAFTSAISRLTSDDPALMYVAPPSPQYPIVNCLDPLRILPSQSSEDLDPDAILIRPKRRRVLESELSEIQKRYQQPEREVPQRLTARDIYGETKVNLETLIITSPCNVCRNCGMQLFSSTGSSATPNLSPADMFCSESCRLKHASVLKQRVGRPPANSLPNLLYSDPVISQVPVLIQGPPSKLCKNLPKSSSVAKLNRRQPKEFSPNIPTKRWKGSRWAVYSSSKPLPCVSRSEEPLPPILSNWLRPLLGGHQLTPVYDTRICEMCKQTSDANESLAGRLLNYTCDKWIHVNCVLWCYEAYETLDGCLMNVAQALEKTARQKCSHCHSTGAGTPCFAVGCPLVYHVHCAYKVGCSFHEDRSMFCPTHQGQAPRTGKLESLKVSRRVYLARDEYDLVADVIGNQCLAMNEHSSSFRVGTLILNSIGQLLPEHLESGRFHNSSFIFPVGFSTTRIYWSYRRPGQRCHYTCAIADSCSEEQQNGEHEQSSNQTPATPSPVFTVTVTEPGLPNEQFKAQACGSIWQQILTAIRDARKRTRVTSLTLFPDELLAEDLFGLSEPHIVRAIESLPGVEHLRGYVFKFGKMQLITKMPLMVNPTGCARSEPKLRTYVRSRNRDQEGSQQQRPATMNSPPHLGFLRPLTQIPRTCSPTPLTAPIGKHSTPIMSKYQQYRRLKVEWKNNVLLARSKIQGLGLFAARDIEKHEFIIEYLGQMIRNEVGNQRERLYESQNRGIYMFRADDECIVDATMYGGLARYINHSCEPNCIAEVFAFEAYKRIIIIAKRLIKKGEELTYDYKFDFEDDKPSRIPCLCGAQFCRKWMN